MPFGVNWLVGSRTTWAASEGLEFKRQEQEYQVGGRNRTSGCRTTAIATISNVPTALHHYSAFEFEISTRLVHLPLASSLKYNVLLDDRHFP